MNYRGDSALVAVIRDGETVLQKRFTGIGGNKGKICSLQHGKIVWRVSDTDQNFASQRLFELLCGAAFGYACKIYFDDPRRRAYQGIIRVACCEFLIDGGIIGLFFGGTAPEKIRIFRRRTRNFSK